MQVSGVELPERLSPRELLEQLARASLNAAMPSVRTRRSAKLRKPVAAAARHPVDLIVRDRFTITDRCCDYTLESPVTAGPSQIVPKLVGLTRGQLLPSSGNVFGLSCGGPDHPEPDGRCIPRPQGWTLWERVL